MMPLEAQSGFFQHLIAVAYHNNRQMLVRTLKSIGVDIPPEQFVVLMHANARQPVSQADLAVIMPA